MERERRRRRRRRYTVLRHADVLADFRAIVHLTTTSPVAASTPSNVLPTNMIAAKGRRTTH